MRKIIYLVILLSLLKGYGSNIQLKVKEISLGKLPSKQISPIWVSPDNKKVAYIEESRNKEFVVVNKKKGKKYDEIYGIVFSPDGKNVAYIAKERNKCKVVINEKEGKNYDLITDLIFSPDSKKIGYKAKQDGKWFFVVDGKEGKGYEWI